MKIIFTHTITILSFLVLAISARGMIALKKIGHGYEVIMSKSDKKKTSKVYYKKLVNQPSKFNREVDIAQKKLFLQKKTCNRFIKQTMKLHNKKPFLLSECNSDSCALRRNSNNSNDLRTNFENSLIENLEAPLFEASKKNGINILVFASGGLLTEARIIKSLLKKGVRIKSIRLIDKKYSQFNLKEKFIFEDLLKQLLTCENPLFARWQILELLRLKQFLDFITVNLDNSPIITIYDSYQGLKKDKEAEFFDGGDLLIGIDFMEGTPNSAHLAYLNYQKAAINLMRNTCYLADLNCHNDLVSGSLCKRVFSQGCSYKLSTIDSWGKIDLY